MKTKITLLSGLLFLVITGAVSANNNLTLTSITANYTDTEEIFPTTVLDNLKTNLTVRANYSDGTSTMLNPNDYTLTGDLTVGESFITVSYREHTARFMVRVTGVTLTGITAKYTGKKIIYTTQLDSLKSDLAVIANYNNGESTVLNKKNYILTGSLGTGTRIITVNYSGQKTTFTVTVISRMAVSMGLESNMNSRENFAGGAALSFDYNLPHFFAVGLNFTYSNNFSDTTVFEPAAMFRWYFLKSGYAGLFGQADAGVSIIIEDGDTKRLFLGGLRSGYRLFFNKFYVEPYGRIGYPFAFGIGVMAGMRF